MGEVDLSKVNKGAKVRLRNGKIETVINIKPGIYPIVTEDGWTYTIDGRFDINSEESDCDIIEVLTYGEKMEVKFGIHKAWKTISKENQLEKVQDEVDEALNTETTKEYLMETVDYIHAQLGMVYVSCRDNNIDFFQLMEEHHKKNEVRGYYEY